LSNKQEDSDAYANKASPYEISSVENEEQAELNAGFKKEKKTSEPLPNYA
jgi:hypothetical protein